MEEIKTNKKHIALATDNNYAVPCAVCVTSILENNINCHIFVLTFNLSNENIRLFEQLSLYYKQPIEIIKITNELLPKMQENLRYPKAIYLRLLLPSLLKIDRVLYLDCDMIVRKDISDLFTLDIQDKPCAAVEDNINDDIRNKNRLKIDHNCFNSGMLLINLNYWRDNTITYKILQFLKENHGKLLYPDQDAINVLLGKDILRSPFTYNFQHNFYSHKKNIFLHWTKWAEIDKYKDDPSIIHYTDSIKPWHKECSNPHVQWFWFYAQKHPFLKIKKQSYYPFFYRAIMRITGILEKKSYKLLKKK